MLGHDYESVVKSVSFIAKYYHYWKCSNISDISYFSDISDISYFWEISDISDISYFSTSQTSHIFQISQTYHIFDPYERLNESYNDMPAPYVAENKTWAKGPLLPIFSHVLNVPCFQCPMLPMSRASNVPCFQCQILPMSHTSNVRCFQYHISEYVRIYQNISEYITEYKTLAKCPSLRPWNLYTLSCIRS